MISEKKKKPEKEAESWKSIFDQKGLHHLMQIMALTR